MKSSGTLGWATESICGQWDGQDKEGAGRGEYRRSLTLVSCHHDVRVHLEMLGNEVADGVVLFFDQEI